MVGDVESVRDAETPVSTFTDLFRRLRHGGGPIAVQIPWDVIDAEVNLTDNWQGTTLGSTSPTATATPREDVEHRFYDTFHEV